MLEGTVSIPLAFEPLKPHESINTLLDILFILPQYFYVYLSRDDAKKLRDMFLTTEPWNMNHETGRFGVPKLLTFTIVLWTTVMNEHKKNNKQKSQFLKNLFENPNVSVLKWNSLYNSSVMCPWLN